MKTPRLVPALAAVLFASTTHSLMAQAPEVEQTVRAIPSGAFALRAPLPNYAYYPGFLQTVDRDSFGDRGGPLYAREESSSLQPDVLEELVRNRFPSMDNDEAGISIGRHVTLIRGSAEEVVQIEQVLRNAAANLRGSLSVKASLWPLKDGDRFDTVMDADAFATFRDGRAALWSGQARGVAGEVILLDASQVVPYVYDASVEVAQKSESGDPRIRNLIQGLQLRVECEASHEQGASVLFGDLLVAELERELVQRSTGDDDLPTLDGPLLQQTRATFSAAIPGGGACALWSFGESGGDGFVVTVQVDRDPVPAIDGYTFVPVRGLTSGRLSVPLAIDAVQRMTQDGEGIFFDGEPASIGVDTLMDLAYQSFGEALENEDAGMDIAGGQIVLRGDPGMRRDISAFLRGVADSLLRNVNVDFQVSSQSSDATANPALGGSRGPSMVQHRLIVPCLHGRAITALRGLETTEISNYYLEIAQESVQTDPSTTTVFSGLSVRARPHFDGQQLHLTMDGQVTDIGKIIRRPLEQKENGDLWWHRVGHQYISHHGSIVRGQSTSLGEGVIVDRPGARLRPSVTLR